VCDLQFILMTHIIIIVIDIVILLPCVTVCDPHFSLVLYDDLLGVQININYGVIMH
jgi:hypothetical protein